MCVCLCNITSAVLHWRKENATSYLSFQVRIDTISHKKKKRVKQKCNKHKLQDKQLECKEGGSQRLGPN